MKTIAKILDYFVVVLIILAFVYTLENVGIFLKTTLGTSTKVVDEISPKETGIHLTQLLVGGVPPVSSSEDEIPGEGEEKALLVAEYGMERIETVIVPFISQK